MYRYIEPIVNYGSFGSFLHKKQRLNNNKTYRGELFLIIEEKLNKAKIKGV